MLLAFASSGWAQASSGNVRLTPPANPPPAIERARVQVPRDAQEALTVMRAREAVFVQVLQEEGFEAAWTAFMAERMRQTGNGRAVRQGAEIPFESKLQASSQLTLVAIRLERAGKKQLAEIVARGVIGKLGDDLDNPGRGLVAGSLGRDQVLGLLHKEVLSDHAVAGDAFLRVIASKGSNPGLETAVLQARVGARATASIREAPYNQNEEDEDE